MTDTALTKFQQLVLERQGVKGYAAIRAFYRSAQLAKAMGDIRADEYAELVAYAAEEREWLDRQIEQLKASTAARKQLLVENDAYRDLDLKTLDLPALGFDKD